MMDFDEWFKKSKRENERSYGVRIPDDPKIKLQTNVVSIVQYVLADNKTLPHLFSTDKKYARNFKNPFPFDLTDTTIFYFTYVICENKTKECIDGNTGKYFCDGGVYPLITNISYNHSKFKMTLVNDEIHLSKCKYCEKYSYLEMEINAHTFPEKIKEALTEVGYDVKMCEWGVLDFSYMGEMYNTICVCIANEKNYLT